LWVRPPLALPKNPISFEMGFFHFKSNS